MASRRVKGGFPQPLAISLYCGSQILNLWRFKFMRKSNRLSRIYTNMKYRCNNPKSKDWQNYGGRGITICAEWLNQERVLGVRGGITKGFLAFKTWALKNGYADDLTIDRIDSTKGYSPENCRWVNWKVQENNTRRNHFVSYNGKTQTIKQWSEELNLNYRTIINRINCYGYSVEKAFEEKVIRGRRWKK